MTGEDGIVEVVLVFRFLPYPFFFFPYLLLRDTDQEDGRPRVRVRQVRPESCHGQHWEEERHLADWVPLKPPIVLKLCSELTEGCA